MLFLLLADLTDGKVISNTRCNERMCTLSKEPHESIELAVLSEVESVDDLPPIPDFLIQRRSSDNYWPTSHALVASLEARVAALEEQLHELSLRLMTRE